MIVISVPSRLKAATASLLISVPLIAIEVTIATRSPIWKLPYRSITYWALAFVLITTPLAVWLASAKKWSFSIVCLLASSWIVASFWTALASKYPPLGFFSLFLLLFFVIELNWLKTELGRSFFDPKLTWYQGLPKPIPNLKCHLSASEKGADLRVSRIDRDGVFLFASADDSKALSTLSSLVEKRALDLVLNFREHQINCEGRPILSIAHGAGVGIQFINTSADLKKEIGDFVEVLRGEGYV